MHPARAAAAAGGARADLPLILRANGDEDGNRNDRSPDTTAPGATGDTEGGSSAATNTGGTANPQTCSQAGAVASDGTADTACGSDAAANTGGALNPEQCSAPQSEASADHKEIVANLRDCKLVSYTDGR